MKKWFLTLMCMAGRQRGDGRLLRQYDEHGSDRVPHDDDGCADNSPMATAEATANPRRRDVEALTPAQAGQLAEKIAQAVQQISEIDEAQVVVNNDRALVAVRFDAQYNAGAGRAA